MWTYVGSTASGKNEGIHVGRWNADAGVIEGLRLASACTQPSFQVTASLGSGMYLFSGHQPQETRAALSSFRISANGNLETVSTIEVEDEPESFVQIALDGTHRVLVSVSYRSSKVRTFQVGSDGRLSQPVVEFTLHGSGPNTKRQEKSHSHGAVVSPDNNFVLINDLGTDRIMIYRLDSATGSMEPNDPACYQAKPGSGPRHTVFHPNGTVAYAINELDSTITTMAWDAEHGSLRTLDNTPTTAPDVDIATNRAGEVALDASGRFLYACNRGGVEELLVYNVSPEGRLTLASRIPLDGKEARHFAISPDGKWLVVAEQFSNIVSVYRRDQASGALEPSGSRYPINNPSCISFA
jgi:6-phosphogluconolactonase